MEIFIGSYLLGILRSSYVRQAQNSYTEHAISTTTSSGINLGSNANDTASWAETSVSGLKRLCVSSLAEIISSGVDDESALRVGQKKS